MANGNGTQDPVTNCGTGISNRERIKYLEQTSAAQWTALNDLREHMDSSFDKIRNRLPVWATLVMSLLTGIMGVLLALAMQAKAGT